MKISSFSLIGLGKSLCIVLKVLFLQCQNFLRCECDDKYFIFGCKNMTLEVIYLPNSSWNLSNFYGIIFNFEKGGLPKFGGSKW